MRVKDHFSHFVEYLKQKNYARSSVENYKIIIRDALLPAIGDIKLENLHITDTAKVIEEGGKHGQFGALRAVSALRQYLKYLKDNGHRLPFDWRDLNLPHVPQKEVEYLTADDIAMIRSVLDNDIHNFYDVRLRALFEILLDTGLRISEVLSLNKSDIDWESKEAEVMNAKTKEREKVYFTDRSLYWLKRYLDARNDNWEPLFTGTVGKKLTPCSARNYLREFRKKLTLNKQLKHQLLRKTFVTMLIQKGADIKTVQYLARHKSPRTTLRSYAAIDKERAKEVHQRLLGEEKV